MYTRNTPRQLESSAPWPAETYKHIAKHSMLRALVQCAHSRTSSMCTRTTHKHSKLRWPSTAVLCHVEGTSDKRFQISFLSPGSTTCSSSRIVPPRRHSHDEHISHPTVPPGRYPCEGCGKTLPAPSPPQQDSRYDGFSHRLDLTAPSGSLSFSLSLPSPL